MTPNSERVIGEPLDENSFEQLPRRLEFHRSIPSVLRLYQAVDMFFGLCNNILLGRFFGCELTARPVQWEKSKSCAVLIADIGSRNPVLGARCFGRNDSNKLTPIFVLFHL